MLLPTVKASALILMNTLRIQHGPVSYNRGFPRVWLWGSLLVQLSTHNSLFHYPSGAGMDLINDSQQSGNILIHWQRFSSNLVYFSPHQERALMSTNHRATVHIRYSWKGWRTCWLLVHFQISDFSITPLVKELYVCVFYFDSILFYL